MFPLYHWNRNQGNLFGDIKISKRNNMDMEDTNQDASVEESPKIHTTEMKPPTLFLPHDVILEMEGMQLHVCKQVLVDNSPKFEQMFE